MISKTLVIGILQAPYGLKGELKVRSYSGEVGHFLVLAGSSVTLNKPELPNIISKTWIIDSVREVIPHLLVKFKGIETPEAARAFTGLEITVPREHGAALNDDEYYISDLIGCKLELEGNSVGVVLSVWETGAHSMLEVEIADFEGKKVKSQVPFREPFIGRVDISNRVIELRVPWILE